MKEGLRSFYVIDRRRGVRHSAPRRTRFRNPLDSTWISDFRMDFWISKWISGFRSGFLDFEVDFWISKWISGFRSGFLDFKWISGFQSGFLDFKVDFWISKCISGFQVDFWISFEPYYSEDTAKIYSWTFFSAYMLTIQCHRHFTATSYRQRVRWLSYIYIRILSLIFIHIHTHTACSLIVIHIHTILQSYIIHLTIAITSPCKNDLCTRPRRSAGYKGHSLWWRSITS